MNQYLRYFLPIFLLLFLGYSCDKNPVNPDGTTPYKLNLPSNMPSMPIPADNPLTVEGVALGKKLFYDPILSGDNTQSCGSCHRQHYAFVDSTLKFSVGIDKIQGKRNIMPLFNLAWGKGFFWDGGAANMESQVIGPIQNPVEMHESLVNVDAKLKAHPEYPALFKKAFGKDTITIPLLMKAIAQFERTLVSASSRYDKYARGEAGGTLSDQEIRGMNIFQDHEKGDCNHCHVLGSTFTDFEYRNTGLDSIAIDSGRARITLKPIDLGKFKTPSLRNIEFTAPYMHDGRFATLEECVNHYNVGFHYASNLDGNLVGMVKGRMSAQDVQDLVAFLKTLSDYEFIADSRFAK